MAGAQADRRDEDFRSFVLGCQPRLLRFAEILTRDRGQAEDLTQHGLVKAYAAWRRIRDGSPELYVRRCILNAHTDRWRRGQWREQASSPLPDVAADSDHAARFAERDRVMRALARLTVTERAVMALRYYNGLSEAEIAEELRLAAGTVKSTAARALRKLRADVDLNDGPDLDRQEVGP
jgi:RNA polymerase sigma-70 factor (sigma-E family)